MTATQSRVTFVLALALAVVGALIFLEERTTRQIHEAQQNTLLEEQDAKLAALRDEVRRLQGFSTGAETPDRSRPDPSLRYEPVPTESQVESTPITGDSSRRIPRDDAELRSADIHGGMTAPATGPSPLLGDLVSPTLRLRSKPGARIVVEGTSSLAEWKVEGAIIKGFFQVEPAFLTDQSLKSVGSLNSKELDPKAVLSIPVRSLKSGKPKMDEILLETMKAAEHPDILYQLTGMDLTGEVPTSSGSPKFETFGDLTVAGVTRPCEMEVTLDRLDQTEVLFRGTHRLKLADFGITPPSPQFPGMVAIQIGDEVTVRFEWPVSGQP